MVFVADHDTICAISTPPGVGGIAVIRVSGENAIKITKKICRFLPDTLESHRVYYGCVSYPNNNEKIDEVLVSYFREGKSFTGENTLEISCHGSQICTREILMALISCGARIAEKGEFTFRAFMNGRIDLTQAEAVLSLIESKSQQLAHLSLRQLSGGLSQEVNELADSLHWVLAQLEANIDFAYEDLELASTHHLISRLQQIIEKTDKWIESYHSGKIIKEGIQIALVGQPNAGKSSLLNFLIEEEKSIVTDIPGTTRDQVEGFMMVNGIQVKLIDTAGLRNTTDRVETIGIERTKKLLSSVDLVWLLVDLSQKASVEHLEWLKDFNFDRLWLLGNKADLFSNQQAKELLNFYWKEIETNLALSNKNQKLFIISHSRSAEGIEELRVHLNHHCQQRINEQSVILIQSRHYELFKKIKQSLQKGVDLLQKQESPDLVAFELQEALYGTHEVLGKRVDDEILDRVFKEFCLGK